jgi:hypothetical protein
MIIGFSLFFEGLVLLVSLDDRTDMLGIDIRKTLLPYRCIPCCIDLSHVCVLTEPLDESLFAWRETMENTKMIRRNRVDTRKYLLKTSCFGLALGSSRKDKEAFLGKKSTHRKLITDEWIGFFVLKAKSIDIDRAVFSLKNKKPSFDFLLDSIAIVSAYVDDIFEYKNRD